MSLTRNSGTVNQVITPNQPDSLCIQNSEGCPGDRGETVCGGGSYARIYVDPSFPDEATLNTPANEVANYREIGCFRQPGFDPIDTGILDFTAANPTACFTKCADYGYPLARMVKNGMRYVVPASKRENLLTCY